MNKLIIALILTSFLSCQENIPKKLTTEQRNAIEQTITNKLDTVFLDSVNIDLDKSLGPLWNSPNFVYSANGKSYTYQQLRQIEKETLSTFKKQKFDFSNKEIDIINETVAIVSLQGEMCTTLKSDSVEVMSVSETVIFKLIDHDWKAVRVHESFSPKTK
jgi:hypothetical protein